MPSVNELAAAVDGVPRGVAVDAARSAIHSARARLRRGGTAGDLTADARKWAEEALAPRPRRVINATGVILHTNLGRAPLADRALAAAVEAGGGYSSLEYDLALGVRGSRQAHVEGLLCDLTGADSALVVNNCAAAVLLATTVLSNGAALVISRGQLVEIGDSFRIPDIVAQSGARRVEVGTTNRTRLADYQAALDDDVSAILWVHPSNYRIAGFTEHVELEAVCSLGRPVIADLGSGVLSDQLPELTDEPPVDRAVAAGAAVVCCSGDKLLGGPQAGVMVGERDAIERCRTHPLARALRIDKLSLAALATTLALHRDPKTALAEIPVLRMLVAPQEVLKARAEAICRVLVEAGVCARVVECSGKVGGGSLPLLDLHGPACAVDTQSADVDAVAHRLRTGIPSVVTRTSKGRLLLDPRTLTDEEGLAAATAVVDAIG